MGWWEQNEDDGGGGGDAWPGKVSRSRTESPVSNDPVQQNKSMRTRSRQTSTENGDQQVEPVESNTQPRRRQRPQSTEPMECDLSQDGENEGPITDKTHDLNRLNNNSNNKLSEKSKGVETRGSYIFESPTEEKQIQNGIGENKDDNVEIKTKKTKKKSKKSD